VWDPLVDVAQFAISNFTVAFRRENEEKLLRVYHNTLLQAGVSESQFPFTQCLLRYKRNGIERWLQLLILMVGETCCFSKDLASHTIA
jgi:hypothetical protein